MNTKIMKSGSIVGILLLPVVTLAHGGEEMGAEPSSTMVIGMALGVVVVILGLFFLWKKFK